MIPGRRKKTLHITEKEKGTRGTAAWSLKLKTNCGRGDAM